MKRSRQPSYKQDLDQQHNLIQLCDKDVEGARREACSCVGRQSHPATWLPSPPSHSHPWLFAAHSSLSPYPHISPWGTEPNQRTLSTFSVVTWDMKASYPYKGRLSWQEEERGPYLCCSSGRGLLGILAVLWLARSPFPTSGRPGVADCVWSLFLVLSSVLASMDMMAIAL